MHVRYSYLKQQFSNCDDLWKKLKKHENFKNLKSKGSGNNPSRREKLGGRKWVPTNEHPFW